MFFIKLRWPMKNNIYDDDNDVDDSIRNLC